MIHRILDRIQAGWYSVINYSFKDAVIFVAGVGVGWMLLCSMIGAHATFIVIGFLMAIIPLMIIGRSIVLRTDDIGHSFDTGRLESIERKIDRLRAMESEMEAMEAILTEQVARYEMVFKHVTESILIIDANTCEIIDFNDSAAQSLGYTRAEFHSLRLSDIDYVECEEDVKKRCLRIAKRRVSAFQTTHVCKDGTLLPAFCNSSVIRSDGDALLQTICRYGT